MEHGRVIQEFTQAELPGDAWSACTNTSASDASDLDANPSSPHPRRHS